jgi:hypothetical protein
MSGNGKPPILPGCTVLPPLELDIERSNGTSNKAKGPGSRRKAADRFAVLNAFADYTLATLDRAQIAVWLLLWRDTKPDGLARTSQADLARRAGIAERTARRAVESLRRAGLLTVAYRGGLRRGVSTYRIRPLTKEPP